MIRTIILAFLYCLPLLSLGQSKDCGQCFDDIHPKTVMPVLFDSKDYSDKDSTVRWKPNFSEKLHFFDLQGDLVSTRLYRVYYFDNSAVMIFASNEGERCHACGPIISLAKFSKMQSYDKKRYYWQLESFDKLFMQHGIYGTTAPVIYQSIGTNNKLDVLDFQFSDEGQGLFYNFSELVLIPKHGEGFRSIFFTEIAYNNGGAVGPEDPTFESRSKKIRYLPNSDLEISIYKNDQLQGSESYTFNREQQHYEKKCVETAENKAIDSFYVAQEGDNLFKISKKFNIPLVDLMKINNLKTPNIDKGQKLLVIMNETNPALETDPKTGKKVKVHIVRAGESLSSLAQRYNTSIAKLKELNGMKSDQILEKQKLIIERYTE